MKGLVGRRNAEVETLECEMPALKIELFFLRVERPGSMIDIESRAVGRHGVCKRMYVKLSATVDSGC